MKGAGFLDQPPNGSGAISSRHSQPTSRCALFCRWPVALHSPNLPTPQNWAGDDSADFSTDTPLAGLGYGLPLSRLFARQDGLTFHYVARGLRSNVGVSVGRKVGSQVLLVQVLWWGLANHFHGRLRY